MASNNNTITGSKTAAMNSATDCKVSPPVQTNDAVGDKSSPHSAMNNNNGNKVLLAGEGGEDEFEANENYVIVDIGANLTNKKFSRDLDSVVSRAQDAGKRSRIWSTLLKINWQISLKLSVCIQYYLLND